MRIFFLFSVLLLSVAAHASRARLQALNNSYHLTDPQKIYSEPLNIHYVPDLVLLESGATAVAGTSDYAEALWVHTPEEATRLAIGVGHQPDAVINGRRLINAVAALNYELAQNPIYAVYGWKDIDTSYVVGMYHSSYRDRVNDAAEAGTGITAGIEFGRFQLYADYLVSNNARLATGQRFDGDGTFTGNANYLFESIIFYFRYTGEDLRSFAGGVEAEYHRRQTVVVGLTDSRRRNRNDTFWGMQFVSVNVDCRMRASSGCSASASSITLPLWVGLEVQALENLVFRGSMNQNFLVMQSKDRVGYPAGSVPGANGAPSDFSAGVNSTAVALGVGLRLNRMTVDGVLSTATTGVLNSSSLLSQIGLTYRF